MNVVYILKTYYFCCCSVTKSCPTLCNLMPGFPVLQCLLVFSNSSLLSQRCHSTISSSDVPFSSCPQSFPASVSFPVNWLFGSGGQSIGASASAPVFSMNIQGWYPLGLIDLISLLSKGLSRVFSNTTVSYLRWNNWGKGKDVLSHHGSIQCSTKNTSLCNNKIKRKKKHRGWKSKNVFTHRWHWPSMQKI